MNRSTYLEYPGRANWASRDDDMVLAPTEEAEMTFTYAIIAEGRIVLVADSRENYPQRNELGEIIGSFRGERSKIHKVGKNLTFSVAGNIGVIDTLLEKVAQKGIDSKLSFNELAEAYQNVFQEEYDRIYRNFIGPRAAFLLCGYLSGGGRQTPQIRKLESANGFQPDLKTGSGAFSTGAIQHGAALFLHYRFGQKKLTLAQAKLLAYSLVAEVAKQDETIGPPIEMEVIEAAGSNAVDSVELKKLDSARRKITASIQSSLKRFRV